MDVSQWCFIPLLWTLGCTLLSIHVQIFCLHNQQPMSWTPKWVSISRRSLVQMQIMPQLPRPGTQDSKIGLCSQGKSGVIRSFPSDAIQSWATVSSCIQKWVGGWHFLPCALCHTITLHTQQFGNMQSSGAACLRWTTWWPSPSLIGSCYAMGKAFWWVGTGHDTIPSVP